MYDQVTLKLNVDPWILSALKEDITSEDVSTNSVMPHPQAGEVDLICKEDGIICGLQVFERVFTLLDEKTTVEFLVQDGAEVHKGQLMAKVHGDIRTLLCGERTALNYLQRMSGIATYTHSVAELLKGTGIKLLDTRKTTPNNRIFEKYAVRIGGGNNHRYNLSDGVLLKDNHIGAAGGVKEAIAAAKEYAPFVRKIEVEVENLDMVKEAVEAGADIIMLNIFDVDHPVINGLPEVAPEDTIHEVKRLTGRMVAINLEPAAVRNDGEKSVWSLTEGRRATVENAKKAADMGVDMIVLTGNPGVGVDNRAITKALADLNEAVGDRVILTAGKMHASGILSEAGEKILTKEDAETFIEAGADVLLLPAPGTVPGFTMEHAAELIKTAHEKGVLAMTTIGTSQEGADEETIRQIALMCKMAGADIHHIGDSGYMGMALPENITAYSVAIRGKRHTYRRMAMSLVR